MPDDREIIRAAIRKARELGADVAGAVPAAKLIDCPSAVADGHRGSQTDRGTYIVLGLSHDPEHPELDLWEPGRGTPGDRILGHIGKDLGRWLQETYGVRGRVIPYQLHDGGIYLKDAASLAGIGRMGHNNLVLVPGYGPKIRFRAVWADLDCPDEEFPEGESPCAGCEGYCTRACPMDAFSTGRFSRERCLARMNADKATGRKRIDHCRACELACPAGDEG
ncbi:MAG: epoxyqueuosine reductase [Methanoculleus sp.]|nr:epoxyqueuosine reductase [Methanoculleus sp.]